MDIKILRKYPQGIVVAIPTELLGEYGGRIELPFSDWKAASRAFSKEVRRLARAKMNDHWGTCPLKADLTPVYQSTSKIRRDVSPKTYKLFTVTR